MKSFLMTIALASLVSTLEAQAPSANLRKLDSLANAPVAANRVVGLVAAAIRGNDTLLFKGYGKANLEWDVPMPADAMFEIGSVSKQFAAVSILQLRDEGKLSLDDEITKYFPALDTKGNKVTLRRLLTHTSGIRGFADEDEWEGNWFIPGLPRDSMYRRITLDPFLFPSGTAQAYSNSGFWLLGAVVEKASGMKYEDYLATKIFTPLGMKRSMFCNSFANVSHRAHGYGMQGPMVRRSPMVNYTIVSAPGGICSTAGDLVTWLQALHGGKVLSPKSYTEMTARATLDDGTTANYGMGIKVGENYLGQKFIGHGGTAPGFRADATWYPEGQLAVVVLTNTSPSSLSPGGISTQLAEALVPAKRPTIQYFTGDAAPFIGRYEYVVGGNPANSMRFVEVTMSPTGLAVSPNGQRAQPLPWAGGMTFYGGDNTTLTFRRVNGVVELVRDDAGNVHIFRKR
jgi:CubicO group peptidase (beta-lactamase class C family)